MNAKAVAMHDLANLLHRFRRYIEKRSDALAAEEHAADVFIGLDGVIYPGFGEHGLEPQSVPQPFRDIDKVEFPLSEKIGLLTHAGIGARSLA